MKTVVGVFDDFGEAESAAGDLVRLGLPAERIGFLSQPDRLGARTAEMSSLDLPELGRVAANRPMLELLEVSSGQRDLEGAVAAFQHLGISRNEALSCVDRIKSGGTLEAVVIEDDREAEAVEVMRRHLNEELRARERASALAGTPLEATVGQERSSSSSMALDERERPRELTGDVVIPVIQEELSVGKREIDAGGVRVSTHVSEIPVERTVTVREERIHVERRKVDRPVGETDDAYREQMLRMTTSREEPVITKRARVVEEIRVHKDATERIERIHDTLRHTDVQLSDIEPGIEPERSFDASLYHQHFKENYEGQNYTFEWVSPAYQFGEKLRHSSGDDWSSVEGPARSAWEEKNPGTWDRFVDAIKTGWEKARAKV